MAEGGPIRRAMPVIVGEHGPEVFIPASVRETRQSYLRSLSPRQRLNSRLHLAFLRFEEWLCDRPDWLSDHDWLYDRADKFCRILGHIPDGPSRCLYCGKA